LVRAEEEDAEPAPTPAHTPVSAPKAAATPTPAASPLDEYVALANDYAKQALDAAEPYIGDVKKYYEQVRSSKARRLHVPRQRSRDMETPGTLSCCGVRGCSATWRLAMHVQGVAYLTETVEALKKKAKVEL
jgi:hypothetical protein